MSNVSFELLHGDCLELMKSIPNKSIDLCLTDPPYGIGMSKNPFRGKFEKSGWDNFKPSKEYFDEILRVSKHQIIFGGNYFTEYLPPSRCFYVWDKNNLKSLVLQWLRLHGAAETERQRYLENMLQVLKNFILLQSLLI